MTSRHVLLTLTTAIVVSLLFGLAGYYDSLHGGRSVAHWLMPLLLLVVVVAQALPSLLSKRASEGRNIVAARWMFVIASLCFLGAKVTVSPMWVILFSSATGLFVWAALALAVAELVRQSRGRTKSVEQVSGARAARPGEVHSDQWCS